MREDATLIDAQSPAMSNMTIQQMKNRAFNLFRTFLRKILSTAPAATDHAEKTTFSACTPALCPRIETAEIPRRELQKQSGAPTEIPGHFPPSHRALESSADNPFSVPDDSKPGRHRLGMPDDSRQNQFDSEATMFFRKAPGPGRRPSDQSVEAPPPALSVSDHEIVSEAPPAPTEPDDSSVLVLSLDAIAQGWPDSVRIEIDGLNGVNPKVAMPTEIAEQALKRGRLAFSWKTVRSWIRPVVPPAVSPHDNLTLELPLIAVAPLFLARKRGRHRASLGATIDDAIPNLFPEPSKQPPPAETQTQPNAGIVWWNPDQEDRSPADSPANATLQEEVTTPPIAAPPMLNTSPAEVVIGNGNAAEQRSTPDGVVSRCTQLKGITGALIASSEGFVVADQLPAGMNPATVAAFVPQIFRKMSQSTRELRVGELSSVSLSFDNRSWQIFQSRDMFLAVIGATGELVSAAIVAELVSDLERPT